MKYQIHNANVADIESLDLGLFDAAFCDPPYGISFMSKRWDHSVPSPELWLQVLNSLKPGASLFAFGGTKKYHRLASAIEDCGFEIRDTLMWLYGSGFPKNHDLGNGFGTALKPAYEPICVGMKPRDGSFKDNFEKHGVAGLNIKAGRIDAPTIRTTRTKSFGDTGAAYGGGNNEYTDVINTEGRWPSNLILDPAAGELLDAQTGEIKSGIVKGGGDRSHGPVYGVFQKVVAGGYGESGGASRFFYCAKASREEREAGLDSFRSSHTSEVTGRKIDSPGAKNSGYSGMSENHRKNLHPTVKPIDLCRYFAAMLLPPERSTPRRILVPFSGSGSEMIGCLLAGWDEIVGIELDQSYTEIAAARLLHWDRYGIAASERIDAELSGQSDLLDFIEGESDG